MNALKVFIINFEIAFCLLCRIIAILPWRWKIVQSQSLKAQEPCTKFALREDVKLSQKWLSSEVTSFCDIYSAIKFDFQLVLVLFML